MLKKEYNKVNKHTVHKNTWLQFVAQDMPITITMEITTIKSHVDKNKGKSDNTKGVLPWMTKINTR